MLSTAKTKFQYQYLLIGIAVLVLALAFLASRLDFAEQQVQIPVTGGDLTTLGAADISAYRWEAMAKFYAGQESPNVKYGPPGR